MSQHMIIMSSADTNLNCHYKPTVIMRPLYQKRDLTSDTTKAFFFLLRSVAVVLYLKPAVFPDTELMSRVYLCQCSQERRTSGCSGTRWRTPQGRPKRRPKTWLRRHPSRRSPSSMSDSTDDAAFTFASPSPGWTGLDLWDLVNLDLLNFVSLFRSHHLGRKRITLIKSLLFFFLS